MAVNKSKINGAASSVDAELMEWVKERQSKMLEILTPSQEKLMRIRYGLDDGIPRTYAELGDVFKMSVERVRQTEALCLRRLRHPKNRI